MKFLIDKLFEKIGFRFLWILIPLMVICYSVSCSIINEASDVAFVIGCALAASAIYLFYLTVATIARNI